MRQRYPVVVVDASVVAAIVLNEPRASAAVALLSGRTLVAPSLLTYEVANAGLHLARRRPEEAAAIGEALAMCWRLPFRWVTPDPSEVLALALETGLTCYDAAYLEIALQAALPLVTFDERLAAAWRACMPPGPGDE